MCRKLVVINKLGLGTRELGYEVYSLPKGEVLEFTAKQLRDIIKAGKEEAYGLKIGENGIDLVFDEGFFTTNMMYKVHIGSLTPMVQTDCLVNLFYVVIGTHVQHGEVMYDVVSSRFERTSFTEEKVKILLNMGVISGGAKLDENGKIVVAPLEKVKKPVEEKKVPVEEVKALEEKSVAEVNPVEKEKSIEKENPVEKESSLEKENPLVKKEVEKVVKVEEKKKG